MYIVYIPEREMEENNDKKDKKTEVGFDLTIKNETQTVNGNIEDATTIYGFSDSFKFPIQKQDPATGKFSYEIITLNLSDYINKDGTLSIKSLTNTDGNGAKAYSDLKSYINTNKNNPELLEKSISNLLEEFWGLRDKDENHIKIGNSQEEIMDKIINAQGDNIEGFICMTMHEFVMKTLNECGINAVTLCGGTSDGSHATLLYQLEDGKYVWNNYGDKVVVSASNIKDAIVEIYKNSGELNSCGYYTIVDGKTSYQEFALEREAAFGDKMDKRDYQNLTPFDNKPDSTNSINGRAEVSTLGNIKVGVDTTLGIEKNNKDAELTFNVEYKRNNETELFLNSQSFGIDSGYKSIKHKDNGRDVFFDVNLTSVYTTGKTGALDYKIGNQNEVDQVESVVIKKLETLAALNGETCIIPTDIDFSVDSKHSSKNIKDFSTFIKTGAGFTSEITSSDNMSLKHAFQGSLLGGFTIGVNNSSIFGDTRILAEEGLQLQNKTGNVRLENTISGGLGVDLRLTGGAQKGSLSPVCKFNFGSGVEYSNQDNLTVGVGVQAYGVVTCPSKETGVEGNIYGIYRPQDTKVTIFGKLNAGMERQRLTLGGFNEQAENNIKINTAIGVQLNPKVSVQAGYSRELDKLNPTRNNSAVSIGCKINI